MVIEHIFITTLEAPEALQRAAQFLNSRGFQATPQAAFAMGGQAWSVLEMTRGKKNPSRAKSVVELPQQIRMEWDRGRVTVAASSTSLQESRSTTIGKKSGARMARNQQTVLTGLVMSLQELLEAQREFDTVAATNAALEGQLHAADRSRRRRNMIILLTIFGAFIALITYLTVSSMSR